MTGIKKVFLPIGYLLLAFLIAAMAASCSTPQSQKAQPVTFASLFASPEKYNGKLITIEGFYFQGFEVNVLSEKLENSGYAPGHLVPKGQTIWIEGGLPLEIYDKLNRQQMMGPTERYGKVRLTGTFEYGGQYGHLGSSGSQIVLAEAQLLPYPP
jgi:hypothetical protein